MSKPSFSNIDLWLFEYAEGNLSDDQIAQLELFILQHPELDVDRDMWEMAHVQKKEVAFTDQEALMKRKPIGAYWAVGAGVATMLVLIFGSYAFFGNDTANTEDAALSETVAFSDSKSKEFAEVSAKERELRQEVADLKAIVASLENELSNTRGNNVLASQNNGASIDFNEDAETQNGIQDASSNELASANISAMNSNALVQGENTSGHTPLNNTSGLPETGQNNGMEDEAPERMNAMVSVQPTAIQQIAMAAQPISRETFGSNTAENNSNMGSSTQESQSRSVNYESSYRHKLSKLVRQLRNMANNPIALKNHRDAYHHVPGMTSTDLNFGVTGTMFAPRFQTMSRLQGYGNENELWTNQIGLDGYVYGARGGIGVQMTHNYYNNGGIQSGEVAITYSPKFTVNRKLSIEPAFRFKMGNKLLDSERMNGAETVEFIPGNTIDYYQDGTTPVGRMLWYRDMGLGLNVNTEWFYASAQVDNIFRHKDNIYSNDLSGIRRAGTYFVATVGTDWESDDSQWETQRSKFSLSPYLVYRNYENVNELWAGANFRAYWLTLGASVSSNLDPAASLGVVSSDKRFSLTYNADYSRSYVTNERSLSHQLTLRIVGKQSRIGRRN